MTYYETIFKSKNFHGTTRGMWELVEALKIVKRLEERGRIQHLPNCSECKSRPDSKSGSALYHQYSLDKNLLFTEFDSLDIKWSYNKNDNSVNRDEVLASSDEKFKLDLNEI